MLPREWWFFQLTDAELRALVAAVPMPARAPLVRLLRELLDDWLAEDLCRKRWAGLDLPEAAVPLQRLVERYLEERERGLRGWFGSGFGPPLSGTARLRKRHLREILAELEAGWGFDRRKLPIPAEPAELDPAELPRAAGSGAEGTK